MIVVDRRDRGARWLDALDRAPSSLAARLLAPLGGLYAAGAALHRTLRGEDPLPGDPPSVAIGNLRVGGTGKTPVVHDLGRRLRARGLDVVVLSRGYRAEGGGDEPAWLESAGLRVVLGADRRASFAVAREGGADVVLLDDGLQTRARATRRLGIVLARDLERQPRPLPAGPAREGAAALARADVVLVRRERADGGVCPPTFAGAPCVGFHLAAARWIDADGTVFAPDAPPTDGPVVAVSGLARPDSFEGTLGDTAVDLRGAWRRPDHWTPEAGEIAEIVAWARGLGATALVCPEKNRTRIMACAPALPVLSLGVDVVWDVDDPLRALGLDAWGHAKEDGASAPSSS